MELLFPIPPSEPRQALQLLYDRLSSRLGFGPAQVRLSKRKLTGGEIQYGSPHRITISAHLTQREREDTLRHEAAHAWAFALGGPRIAHGSLFRQLAAQLGAKPGHAPETAALREFRRQREIHYRCEGCRRVFHRMRRFRRRMDCLACWREGRPSRLRRMNW